MKHTLLFAAACVGVWPASAGADHHGHGRGQTAVAGTLSTEVVPCASLCTESDWDGALEGTSRFTLISLEDLQVPDANLSRFRGDLVLSTPRGELVGRDDGTWDLDTGNYVDFYTVTAGTGAFEGARGVIVLFGTLDPVTGRGDSHYRGFLTGVRGR